MPTTTDFKQPTKEELRRAFRAGFQSIDAGDTFYPGFYAYLESIGYRRRDEIGCTCPDRGEHGHLPECRWVVSIPTQPGAIAVEET